MPSTTKQRSSQLRYQIVAIGASAGGLPALSAVLSGIDGEFPAIVVVQHLDPRHKSQMAQLLSKKSRKSVKEAEHGEAITPGHVYIGPPDEHLLVSRGKIQLAHSRLVRYSRPSIDLLFGSVAAVYGEQAIGVVLSGSNRDGADGIAVIKSAGGITLAQEPASAEYRIMPQAAIDTGCVDLVVPLDEMGKAITELLEKGRTTKWRRKSR
ncbi:MAG TPA: chemotaxis protein CheB [Terriglobales bacterium]|nr:chemotaxis protein CheB [Terriglobales bacterium]